MIKISVASISNQASEVSISAAAHDGAEGLEHKIVVSRTQAQDGQQTVISVSSPEAVVVNGVEIGLDRAYPVQPGSNGSAAAGGVDGEALMAAFLHGAGISNVAINWQMTPEFMDLIGKLLATSVDGTFQLLGARAELRREVNADTTVVVVRNNNPLKFLSDSQTALTQMLRKKMPGFMGPVEALQDAYTDLKVHQDCVVAGMQGAVDEALQRLDPHGIESQQGAPGALDAILPSRRKAAMWERYGELHAQTSRGVKQDFQATLGKGFMKAYEAHHERMQDEAHDD